MINNKVDKKIYLALDMNPVLNTDMYDEETFLEVGLILNDIDDFFYSLMILF